jgi:hypothetical protein
LATVFFPAVDLTSGFEQGTVRAAAVAGCCAPIGTATGAAPAAFSGVVAQLGARAASSGSRMLADELSTPTSHAKRKKPRKYRALTTTTVRVRFAMGPSPPTPLRMR